MINSQRLIDEKKDFVSKMIKEMQLRNLSCEDLGKLTNITRQTISNYVRGSTLPTINNMNNISTILWGDIQNNSVDQSKTETYRDTVQTENIPLFITLAGLIIGADNNMKPGVCSILSIETDNIPENIIDLKIDGAPEHIMAVIEFGRKIYDSYIALDDQKRDILNMFISFNKYIL